MQRTELYCAANDPASENEFHEATFDWLAKSQKLAPSVLQPHILYIASVGCSTARISSSMRLRFHGDW